MPGFNFHNPGLVALLTPATGGKFSSMYEAFVNLTTLKKQFFEQWMAAKQRSSIWTTGGSAGSSSMTDDVDQGLDISTGGSNNDTQFIHFNNKRQFNYQASMLLSLMRAVTTTPTAMLAALLRDTAQAGNLLLSVGTNYMAIGKEESSNFKIITADGSTASGTDSDVAGDNSFHLHQGEMTASNNKYTLDGVLKVTKTTNLCATNGLQPFAGVRTGTAAVRNMKLKYISAWNT